MSPATAARLVLTFLAATLLWLRWALLFISYPPQTAYARTIASMRWIGYEGVLIGAVLALLVLLWSIGDGIRWRRSTPVAGAMILGWTLATPLLWIALGILFMLPVRAGIDSFVKVQTGGRYSFPEFDRWISTPFVALFLAIPATAFFLPFVAWAFTKSRERANIAVADASAAFLCVAIAVWLWLGSWKERPKDWFNQPPPPQPIVVNESAYPLKEAAFRGHWPSVMERIQRGERDTDGGVLFAACTRRNDVEIVAALIRTGSPVNARQGDLTPLLYLARVPETPERLEMTRLLLAAGADARLADGSGMTAIDHARAKNNVAMLELLTAATPAATSDRVRR